MSNFKVIKKEIINTFADKTKQDKVLYAVNAGVYGLSAVALEIFKQSGREFEDGSYLTLFKILEPALGVASVAASAALVMSTIAQKTKYGPLKDHNILPDYEEYRRHGR